MPDPIRHPENGEAETLPRFVLGGRKAYIFLAIGVVSHGGYYSASNKNNNKVEVVRGRAMADKQVFVTAANVESRILLIRGQKIMLDADLAELYGVETKRLNEQVRRNIERFPEDFMFQLTAEEAADLRSQNATSSLRSQNATSNSPAGRGGRRYLPYAFTEHGALMLGNVLKSERAVEVSLMVVRAFVRMRELVAGHKELAQKLAQLERKVGAHDKAIAEIINAIRQLMAPEEPKKKRPIGFAPWKEK